MRLTNSARQEAGLFQNIQTVPLCWNGAESLLAVAAGSRGHLTASPAMVTGAVAEMPSTLPPAVRGMVWGLYEIWSQLTPRKEGRRVGVGESERTQTRAPPQQGHQARLLPPPQARSCS